MTRVIILLCESPLSGWSPLPAISEHDRNSILLVFGNRPEFDELG